MDEFEEVKEVVIETLEKTGVISEMKAKVRAHIFKILQNDSKKYKNLNFNIESPSSLKIHESPENMQILEFIIEFLQFYNFDYTLGIIQQEANLEQKKITRELLVSKYKVPKEKVKPANPLINSFFYEGGSTMPKAVFNNFSEQSHPQPSKKEPTKTPTPPKEIKSSKGFSIGEEEEEKPLKFSFKPPNSSVKPGSSSNSLISNIASGFGGNTNYEFDLDKPSSSSNKKGFEVPKKSHLEPIQGPNTGKSTNSSLTSLPNTNFLAPKTNFSAPTNKRIDYQDDSYKYEDDFEIEEDINEDLEFEFSKDDKPDHKVPFPFIPGDIK